MTVVIAIPATSPASNPTANDFDADNSLDELTTFRSHRLTPMKHRSEQQL
jgi:hypothetical protein